MTVTPSSLTLLPSSLAFMFSKLIGNATTSLRLRRMLEANRLPGALLFAGASGTGKKLFAVELAKALNCLAPLDGIEACDRCRACVNIGRLPQAMRDAAAQIEKINETIVWSDHRDVCALIRGGKSVITVKAVRELEREANFRPGEGRRRVFIIDEAERLNEAASNALLKTLEEMPAHAHIILVTAHPDALLTTIRSRCQTLRFAALGNAEIEAYLVAERLRAGAEATLVARLAQGNLALALEMNVDAYRERRDDALAVLEALSHTTPDRAPLLRHGEELNDAKRKDDYELALDALEILTRDVWLLAIGADEARIVNFDVRARLQELAARIPAPQCAAWVTRIEELRRRLAFNLNRRIATDALLLSMAAER